MAFSTVKINLLLMFLLCINLPLNSFAKGGLSTETHFVRITGGPIFFDNFIGKDLDESKWEKWSIDNKTSSGLSYEINGGFTILSDMNCFEEKGYHGIISTKAIRGLTGITLVVDVESYNEFSNLPAIVHLCNCCSEFSDITNDDFWCEVNILNENNFNFNRVEIIKFQELNTRQDVLSKNLSFDNKSSFRKYKIKLEQSIPSYLVTGYIKLVIDGGEYELIGMTTHPYPFSQAKIELKTLTSNCKDKTVFRRPKKLVTYRNLRLYKNPDNNPLFIRVINKNSIEAPGYKIKFSVKNFLHKTYAVEEITAQDGYANLNLTGLPVKEYPIFESNIQIFKHDSASPVFDIDYKTESLSKGIYPGDFWQVFCEKCD